MTATAYIHDRYLDSEERYEIHVVKASERPHLLQWSSSLKDEEKKDDDNNICSSSYPPPLTDGCDIPGWRCERISPCMNSEDIESPLEGSLNIGCSSTLYRRESQFPFISSRLYNVGSIDNVGKIDVMNSNRWWYTAKQKFNTLPSIEREAQIIEYEDACELVDYNNIADINTITTTNDHRRRKITTFCKEYEVKNRPVKILGATKGWLAMPSHNQLDCKAKEQLAQDDHNRSTCSDDWIDIGNESDLLTGGGEEGWTFANLLSRFGTVSFRFSDTHGEMMSLQTYAKYITTPEGMVDDSPLGIYDSEYGDDSSPTNILLNEYTVPECFSTDLFDVVDSMTSDDGDSEEEDDDSKTARPPYRWILIGPERSGTGMHVDPLWTHAWVTVLQGRKRWLLFPPDTPYELIGMVEGKPQIPSSIWFRDYYNKVTSTSWPSEYKPVEVLQNAGETVYVPAGWPHLVLNLELTVAVTHNYASEHGPFVERMCKEVAQDEPQFASRWRRGLIQSGREDLACVVLI